MTCLEKWRKDHWGHQWSDKDVVDNECPSSYGIMDDPSTCLEGTTCEKCWNRIIPEEVGAEFDRATALMILKEFSRDMYPSYDIFGKKTLVINRTDFEAIRKKFLDAGKSE